MTYEAALTLLDYHYWARDRLLESIEPLTSDQFCEQLGNSFSSIRDTLVHILSAEWVWCSRWRGESPRCQLPLADFKTVGEVRARWRSEEARVRECVARLGPDGILREFRYTHFDGVAQTSVFWHMLQHVVNHATFHRGQITTMLRQLGARPPQSQDLIAFYRDACR